MKKSIFLIVYLLLITSTITAQKNREIENLKTFAKVYGYIKYFHPTDEASKIDWKKFSAYGAQEVEKCSTDDELLNILNKIFKPIAPSVKFLKINEKVNFDLKGIIPNDIENYNLTYWQHKGLSYGIDHPRRAYKSVRVNRIIEEDNSNSFGNIMTSMNVVKFRDRYIKYSGWVKLKKGTKGTGHLWLRVNKTDNSLDFFDNMDSNPIIGNQWKKYEITGKIDSLGNSLSLGCYLKGTGQLYFDKAELFYKNKEKWVKIQIKNESFELDSLPKRSSDFPWSYSGDNYSIKIENKQFVEGKKSISINFRKEIKQIKTKRIFNFKPKLNDILEKGIGNNLYVQIPMVLYSNDANTYPIPDCNKFILLEKKVNSIKTSGLYARLGNIINTFNVFQHFYPYFDVLNLDWENEMGKALYDCYQNETEDAHLYTLQKFTKKLKDGHLSVRNGYKEPFAPPISWEWIENKLVITEVYDKNIPINVGDIVTHIDKMTSNKFFKKINSRISAGTKGSLNYKAKISSLIGLKNSKISLTIGRRNIQLLRNENLYERKPLYKKQNFKNIDDSIYYINLSAITMDSINSLLPKLEQSKAIIFDLRGYPKGNHDLISYLLKSDDTSNGWMQTPLIVYPRFKENTQFEKNSWSIKSKKPYLGDKRIVFITNGQAISYAESFMSYIKYYNLATIVGQPTAGANGNINSFSLLGGYEISFTGMKVVKLNGHQLHGIGILPDIYVEKTIEGIRNGKDEFLEKAIEIAKKNE